MFALKLQYSEPVLANKEDAVQIEVQALSKCDCSLDIGFEIAVKELTCLLVKLGTRPEFRFPAAAQAYAILNSEEGILDKSFK